MNYIIELGTPGGTPRYEKVTAPSIEQVRENAIIQAEDAASDPYEEQTFGVLNVYMQTPDRATVEAAALTSAIDQVFADTGNLTDEQIVEYLKLDDLPEEAIPTEQNDFLDAHDLLQEIYTIRTSAMTFAQRFFEFEPTTEKGNNQ